MSGKVQYFEIDQVEGQWEVYPNGDETGNIQKFSVLGDLVKWFTSQEGSIKILDHYHVGIIMIANSKVASVTSEWGLNDDSLRLHWMGIPITEEPEKTRYSIYDVYSPRELL